MIAVSRIRHGRHHAPQTPNTHVHCGDDENVKCCQRLPSLPGQILNYSPTVHGPEKSVKPCDNNSNFRMAFSQPPRLAGPAHIRPVTFFSLARDENICDG